MKKNYKLPVPAEQHEFEAWVETENVSDLCREIGMLRKMMNDCAAEGDRKTFLQLANVLQKTVAQYERAAVRNADWIDKEAIFRLSAEITKVISNHLQRALPDTWNTVQEHIADDILDTVEKMRPSRNSVKAFHRLTDMRSGSGDMNFPE